MHDEIDGYGRGIHYFDSHSKQVQPISINGKDRTFPCENGNSSFQ
jgi:hypothetical protein